jgi:hypothetical protein
MKQNLDLLKTEIQEHLERNGMVTFFGASRSLTPYPTVMWDTAAHPDYRQFVKAAQAAGAQVIVLHASEFEADQVESSLEDLEFADMDPEESRRFEKRLREMRAYDGFTCSVELSFDAGWRCYVFELRTEWYDEYLDLLSELDMAIPDGDEDEDDEGPVGGYFSKN